MIHGFDTHYKELLDAQDGTRATCRACARASAAPACRAPCPIARRARQTFGRS